MSMDEDFKQEIRERLVRMETKLDDYSGIKTCAYDALNRSKANEKDISEIKDNQKWLWRTTVTSLVALACAIIAIYIK